MQTINRIIAIIALAVITPTAYSGSITDTFATGDTLTATLLNNAKTAINDNDSRATALEAADGVTNGKVTALEAADVVTNGKVTALEAADGVTDGKVTALEAADGVTDGKVTALEAADGVTDGKVTALEAADSAMNVRVSILETKPRAKTGFGDPSSSIDAFITGSEIGTVYIEITSGDVYMSVAIISNTAVWKQLTPKKYAIGDVGPAGGWVFYVTGDGLHGFEAAKVDQSTSAGWGCSAGAIPGANGTRVGSGARNTGDILAAGCAAFPTSADLADAYAFNGYTDWFLPSKDELNAMYLNIGPGNATLGNVGGFSLLLYWSSSQISTNVSVLHFGAYDPTALASKINTYHVRAIRAF